MIQSSSSSAPNVPFDDVRFAVGDVAVMFFVFVILKSVVIDNKIETAPGHERSTLLLEIKVPTPRKKQVNAFARNHKKPVHTKNRQIRTYSAMTGNESRSSTVARFDGRLNLMTNGRNARPMIAAISWISS